MDEIKDNMNLENINSTKDSDTDTTNTAQQTDDKGYDLSDFEGNSDNISEEASNDQADDSEMIITEEVEKISAKKKGFINPPIIISAVIVAVFALTLLVVKGFFDTSVIGNWYFEDTVQYSSSSSDDEVVSIKVNRGFEFESNNVVKLREGTFTTLGAYSLQQDDSGNNTISLYIPMASGTPLQGTFNYSVSGNIFTGRTFVITSTSSTSESAQLELKSGTVEEPQLVRSTEFTPNKELLGKWVFSNGLYNISFEFFEDGTAQSIQDDTYIYDYLYDCSEDGYINRIYYTIEQIEDQLVYSIDGDTLTLNGLEFIKETTSTADE